MQTHSTELQELLMCFIIIVNSYMKRCALSSDFKFFKEGNFLISNSNLF